MAAHQNNESLEGLVDKAVLVYYRKAQHKRPLHGLSQEAEAVLSDKALKLFGSDLYAAAKAVVLFLEQVQFNKDWQQLRNPACLNAAQRRFVRFLQLLACSSKPAELVPPVDVALVWLCYRLRETFFAADLSVMGFS